MHKVHKNISADEFQFDYSNKNEEEIKGLFGVRHFRDLYHNTKQATKELWDDNFCKKHL